MTLPCPFCGSSLAVIDTLNYYISGEPAKFQVQCEECRTTTGWFTTERAAWERWNTRTPEVL
jgi:Lar family restriction alleviation protein